MAFQPVQGAFAGERGAARAPCLGLAGQGGEHRVMAQLVMIDQVLVAKGNADDALHHQDANLMLDQLQPPTVAEARRKPLRQPGPLRRLSIRYVDGTLATSARSAASGSGSSAPTSDVMAPPAKLATTSRPAASPNPHRSALHSVGIGKFLQLAEDPCYKRTFADSEPRCTYPRKKCEARAVGINLVCN